MKAEGKPKYSTGQNVGYMLKLAWDNYKSVLWMCVIWAVLSLSIKVVQLFVVPVILEKVETLAALPELLGAVGMFAVALIVLNGLLGYVEENMLYGRVSVRTLILNEINQKACTTSYPNSRDPETLKLLEKALEFCSSNLEASEKIWTTLSMLLLNGLGFVVYLTLLADLNGLLILVVVLTTVACFFVSRYINEWGYRHREEEAEYNKQINYFYRKADSITMAKDIRIFGLAQWLGSLYQKSQNLCEAFIKRRERIYTLSCVVDVILDLARNSIAYLYLIRMALNNGLSASRFLLYFTAFSGFSAWITGILDQLIELHKESIALSTIREYLNLPEMFRFEEGKEIPAADRYELKLENVSFGYPGTDQKIIRNLNLTLHPGEKIAVVGLNGAGKTTLVKLLCGFYDPDEGRVLLNGTDIREFNRREYYRLFSAVFQEFSELDVTVAQAVAQEVSDIDLDKVRDCIAKAGLTEQIEAFPKNYDTHLGKKVYEDGVQLSGGQTQRLMLARALYKNGPFLILDEPTAALDPIAENDLYQKYNEMTEGKSSVFISHRLASTRFCDRILFIENGVIAEEGTHEELLQRGGGYARLFEVQARYYREGREF